MNLVKTLSVFLIIFSLLAGKTFANPAGNDERAVKEIIAKFSASVGGPELAGVKTIAREGKLIRGVSGRVPFKMTSTSSGNWHYNQTFAYGDQVSYGFDGSDAWLQDTKSISDIPEEELLDLKLLLAVNLPDCLQKIFTEMKIKGAAKEGDKPVTLVEAVTAKGLRRELAFDSTSGLLLRAGDLYITDYFEKDKIKVPGRIFIGPNLGEDDLRLLMEVSDVKLSSTADASLFARPVNFLTVQPSPLYTIWNEITITPEAMNSLTGRYQSQNDTSVYYNVRTQKNHLMFDRDGRRAFEIKPTSEVDFFVRYINLQMHFVKDINGKVTSVEFGPDRAAKAVKIK